LAEKNTRGEKKGRSLKSDKEEKGGQILSRAASCIVVAGALLLYTSKGQALGMSETHL